MGLEKQLLEDMNKALKAGDKIRLETIRGLRSQLKNAEIAKGDKLSEEEVVQVLSGAAKKRRESIEQFRAVGRSDRADTEQQELEIYLAKSILRHAWDQVKRSLLIHGMGTCHIAISTHISCHHPHLFHQEISTI